MKRIPVYYDCEANKLYEKEYGVFEIRGVDGEPTLFKGVRLFDQKGCHIYCHQSDLQTYMKGTIDFLGYL
jgi:hypothetical protein